MIELFGCVSQRGDNVFPLKMRHFILNFFKGKTGGQKIQNIDDSDSHSSDTGAPVTWQRIKGDPISTHVLS